VLPHLAEIDDLVQRMRSVVVPREAVAHLEWTQKEPTRLALFERVVVRRRAR